jgi:hypothetical protein
VAAAASLLGALATAWLIPPEDEPSRG